MIALEALTKRYGPGPPAVDALSLEVVTGEVCALIGPSGSGKSTTLRMVNRLIEPTSGKVWLDGEDVTALHAVDLRRRMGYVIQQVGLFPHLSVAENVGTVPRLLGWDRRRVDARVEELLTLVGLPPREYASLLPGELSGTLTIIVITGKLLLVLTPSMLVQVAVCVPIPLHVQEGFVLEKLLTV